jgi:hypothetical protein
MGKTGNELDENDDGSSFFSLSLSLARSLSMSLFVPARQEGGGALISTTFAFNTDWIDQICDESSECLHL